MSSNDGARGDGRDGVTRSVLGACPGEGSLGSPDLLLNGLGYPYLIARDAEGVLGHLRQGTFACLLVGCERRGAWAADLVAAVRAASCPDAASVPIVALLPGVADGQSIAGVEGADDYLTLPVSADALASRLGHWMEGAARPQFDGAILERMVGDDRDLQARVVARFLEVVPQTIDALRAAMDDSAALQKIAHRFKSSTRSVGLVRLGEACVELEARADLGEEARLLMPLTRQIIRLTVLGARELESAFGLEAEV